MYLVSALTVFVSRARVRPGIAGCSLIFPTISSRWEVTVEELEAAIELRIEATMEEMLATEPHLGAAAGVESGTSRMPEGARFLPWQYLPPLLFARHVMRLFGIRSVQLVDASNVSGLLRDESYFSDVHQDAVGRRQHAQL